MQQSAAKRTPLELFCAYSHKDHGLKEEFSSARSVLRRNDWIQLWTDQEIRPGERWENKISAHLLRAEIIVFLVSADFISSEYCYCVEMATALKRARENQCIAVPIIVRACDWRETPLKVLQVLPHEGRPVTSWGNRDEAWLNVSIGLKAAVKAALKKLLGQVDNNQEHGSGVATGPFPRQRSDNLQDLVAELNRKIGEIDSDLRKSERRRKNRSTALLLGTLGAAAAGGMVYGRDTHDPTPHTVDDVLPGMEDSSDLLMNSHAGDDSLTSELHKSDDPNDARWNEETGHPADDHRFAAAEWATHHDMIAQNVDHGSADDEVDIVEDADDL